MCVRVTEGPLESPKGDFGKMFGRNLRKKKCVKYSFSLVSSSSSNLNLDYSIPVALTAILTSGEEKTSVCHLSNETKTIYVLQMVQERLRVRLRGG